MEPEIVYLQASGPFWDWHVAFDLYLGGVGVGALLLAVLIDELRHGKHPRLCQTAAWLAPVTIGAGLLLILLKLGRPQALLLSYTTVNVSAPLWWGGIFQPLLLLGGIVYAFLWSGNRQLDSKRRWLGRVLAPLALAVGMYHGLLLATMSARVLWTPAPTIVVSMLGFAATGIAAVLLLHLLRMKCSGQLSEPGYLPSFLDDLRFVRNLLFVVLLLQAGTCVLWWLGLQLGGMDAHLALASANAAYGPLFWGGGVGLGLLLPLALGAIAVCRGEAEHRGFQVGIIGLSSFLILVGGLFFRFALVLGGQLPLPPTLFF